MTTITQHNVETGEILTRELTAEEIAENEANAKKAEAEREERAKLAAEKQAVLDKLGLSPEEAAVLLA